MINKIDFDKMELGDLNYYLIQNIKNLLNEETEIMDNTIYIPKFSLSVRPNTMKADKNMAVINFHLHSDKWDREVFECSASLGRDRKQAFSMAEGSFLFGILTGIRYMANDEYFQKIETEFNGFHSWKMYSSDIVGVGDIPDTTRDEFWDIIKDEIPKYLGNQKMTYIKVFVAKNGNEITGECRINDEPIKELGALLSQYVSTWNTHSFGSKKQFFFAVQDDSTYIPYPYDEDQMEKFVLEASSIFEKCETEDDFNNMIFSLGEKIKDYDLAEELINFIPEICAERGFPDIEYPESIDICIGEDKILKVNKSQIASYYMIKKAVNHMIDHGHIMKTLFHKYIGISSTYSVIYDAKEKKGVDITQNKETVISTIYGFSKIYNLR
ncbi:DUF6348 family protein [Fusobacterium sp.]|uniref:DUF6348 family protein n=1 Tax=Fusobacterium sp. TaxID=68766 RepID=UPI002622AE80|nr:DUF6348 family protein [Fusobacterium sp.]